MDLAVRAGGQTVAPKRRESRLPAALNIRLLGIDAKGKPFHQAAMTLDVSLSGARITGLHAELSPGDVVGLQSGGDKCRFKVVWVAANRDGTFQAGLHCVEKGKSLWREQLNTNEATGDRRTDKRYPCSGSVSLRSAAFATPIWGTVRDIGAGGCYVQTVNVAPVGDVVSGQFTLNGMQFEAVAEVRSSRATVGMGLLWCDLGFDGQDKLQRLLRTLAVNHTGEDSLRQRALEHVDKIHQLLTAVRERLESEKTLVDAQMVSWLNDAQENLATVIKNVPR